MADTGEDEEFCEHIRQAMTSWMGDERRLNSGATVARQKKTANAVLQRSRFPSNCICNLTTKSSRKDLSTSVTETGSNIEESKECPTIRHRGCGDTEGDGDEIRQKCQELRETNESSSSSSSTSSSSRGLVGSPIHCRLDPYTGSDTISRSFSSNEKRRIKRENQNIVRRILAQQRGARPSSTMGAPVTLRRPASSAINRKERHRQIECQNQIIKRRLQEIQRSTSRLHISGLRTRPRKRHEDLSAPSALTSSSASSESFDAPPS